MSVVGNSQQNLLIVIYIISVKKLFTPFFYPLAQYTAFLYFIIIFVYFLFILFYLCFQLVKVEKCQISIKPKLC